MNYNIPNLLLLLGFCLFCSVPSTSLISSWDLQCKSPRSQRRFLRLLQSAIGFIKRRQFHICLFSPSSPTWLLWTSLVRLGFAEQLQAGTAKRKTPHSQNAIYFDRHFSASTAPWVLTRGEAPSAYWFNSTHNSAALRLVPSIPHPGGK
jgi:hypothetical protein